MAEQRAVYVVGNNGHAGAEPEPIDRLSANDVSVIVIALRLYYGDMLDLDVDPSQREHVARLSERLANASRTWIAEASS